MFRQAGSGRGIARTGALVLSMSLAGCAVPTETEWAHRSDLSDEEVRTDFAQCRLQTFAVRSANPAAMPAESSYSASVNVAQSVAMSRCLRSKGYFLREKANGKPGDNGTD